MITKDKAISIVDGIFLEEALLLGGIIATSEIDDEIVEDLLEGYQTIREKALHKIDHPEEPKSNKLDMKPHPAVQSFLKIILQNRKNTEEIMTNE